MAADDGNGSGDSGRRISLSEQRITEIVENAVLKLQIELGKMYAAKEDVRTVSDNLRTGFEAITKRQDTQDGRIDGLEKDKAGREAVEGYKKWLIGGGIFTTLFAGVQLAVSLYLLNHGH